MRNYCWILFVFLLAGCSVIKQAPQVGLHVFNFDLHYKGVSEIVNLKGIAILNPDSGYFNLYGPLGINVSKIFVVYDSVFVVDLMNKRIFKFQYVELSQSFSNIFTGKFSQREEHLVSSLCYLFLRRDGTRATFKKPEFYFDFIRGNVVQRINLTMVESGNEHLVKIKMKPAKNVRMISRNSLSKYNFETITLNLQ